MLGVGETFEEVAMATQTTRIDVIGLFDCPGDKETVKDLDIYLLALYSYPDQFADRPQLSFQQHLENVIHAENRRLAGNLQS
ncbi:MAG: hypothetical protein DMG69_20385 [Acidobacteria bacterium]|nr:MAG: hypothetical protein DMG69_20385 [Acidobacteriota bacterium]